MFLGFDFELHILDDEVKALNANRVLQLDVASLWEVFDPVCQHCFGVHFRWVFVTFLLTKENGLYTINYAFKKHNELTEEFVQAIGNFTNGGEQMN